MAGAVLCRKTCFGLVRPKAGPVACFARKILCYAWQNKKERNVGALFFGLEIYLFLQAASAQTGTKPVAAAMPREARLASDVP